MTRHLVRTCGLATAVLLIASSAAFAQTSSIGGRLREKVAADPPQTPPREKEKEPANPVYLHYAWTTSPPPPPKEFRVDDLITVVVRQSVKYEADADLSTEHAYDIKTEFEAFAKLVDGGLAPVTWSRGKPNIDVTYDDKLENKGDTKREDQLTTRLTVKIIDVKPNGQLLLEGRGLIEHNDETSKITITGICRKEDITADNTVLSTQIADVVIRVKNKGALRNAAKRGWLTKFYDAIRPL